MPAPGPLDSRRGRLSVVGESPTRWKLLKDGKIDVGLQPIPNSYEAEAADFTNLARNDRGGPLS